MLLLLTFGGSLALLILKVTGVAAMSWFVVSLPLIVYLLLLACAAAMLGLAGKSISQLVDRELSDR